MANVDDTKGEEQQEDVEAGKIDEKLEKFYEKLEKADEQLEKVYEKLEKADEQLEKAGEELEKADEKLENIEEKASRCGIFPWILMFVIVLFAGAGFILGRFFPDSRTPETVQNSHEDKSAQLEYLKAEGSTTDFQKAWYYDLEPVVANLDEPGTTRYVRVTITLVISPQVDKLKGNAFLDEKKPLLTNCLTLYLASLSIEDARGDMNLKRIQSQILDTFNEKLFPGGKPKIQQILFKEFAIQ
ncbi:MAG: flagellar basal body-associated FliL family protein [Planctomycetota bacterium]|jgi:flagellar basal body-associated protein FliL